MNWGKRIAVLYISFVIMIVALVVISSRQDVELESKDYYAQELKYQQKINALNNTNKLTSSVTSQVTEKGVLLSFPKEQVNTNIKGDALFFCTYDSKKDKRIELKLNTNGEQLIPLSMLSSGKYTLKISWNVLGKDFYKENSVTIK